MTDHSGCRTNLETGVCADSHCAYCGKQTSNACPCWSSQSAGTFTLSLGAVTSDAIPINASSEQINAARNALLEAYDDVHHDEKEAHHMMFVCYTETNDHEGETWTFWLQLEGNEENLGHLERILDEVNSELIDPEYELFGYDVLPEEHVDVLVQYGGEGYMSMHNKVVGRMTPIDSYSTPELYKGGITKLFKTFAPDHVPLRRGDRFGLEHIAMLQAQGFAGEVVDSPAGYTATFTGPDTDGRVLVITADHGSIIETMSINTNGGEGLEFRDYDSISLTPLPTTTEKVN